MASGVNCVCSAEALAAAPAATDVDAKKNENRTIDTCHESEKKRGAAPGARPGEKHTPGNGQFYATAFLFSDNLPAPERPAGAFGARGSGSNRYSRQCAPTHGRLKRVP